MSWLSKFVGDVSDEVARAPANIGKFIRNPLGQTMAGLKGLFAGKKGFNRGPRYVGPIDHKQMPDLCRITKGGGSVITDEEECIYDYKALTGAQTANGADFFDDTTTTNITEAKKLPAGLYKAVSLTIETDNAADSLGMVMDAIVRMKSGKNGDITWERSLADLSDFILVDSTAGVIVRQDGVHSEDADIVVLDDNDLNYFNVLFPSIPTFTGTVKATLRLRKFPEPKGLR